MATQLSSALFYQDPKAALTFLQDALGFELTLLLEDSDGNLAHSQLSLGEGKIMVGTEWSDDHKSPKSIGGKNTQTVHIQLDQDIDAHCERARKAGAEIIAEPETQFYGDRTYRCRDPEGHIWTLSQAVEVVSIADQEAATGLTYKVGA